MIAVHRVVVCENCLNPADPALARLVEDGFEIVHCRTCEAMLENVLQRRPDAVVCQIRPQSHQDLGVLQLLRRINPAVPLVLLSNEGSLDMQRLLPALQPTYFAIVPIEANELSDAIHGALVHARAARD